MNFNFLKTLFVRPRYGRAGGHLAFEVGVKKKMLSEAQPSSFSLANKNWQVAERSRAAVFATFVSRQK